MTRERIDALESDKRALTERIEILQCRVDALAPDNARLAEALANARWNNRLATILVGIGTSLISFAPFTGRWSQSLANAAAGSLIAGFVVMLWQSFRRGPKRPDATSLPPAA